MLDNKQISIPFLDDCWAKTDPITLTPVLSVREHCLTVGHIAERLSKILPPSIHSLLPVGFASLIAAHDIGKITPGFQLKCSKWKHFSEIKKSTHLNGLETNHAAVSQSHLQYAASPAIPRLANFWLISTAGHHGSYPHGYERLDKKAYEGGNQAFGILRSELEKIIIDTFGSFPTESAKKHLERIHLLTGLTIFADWIGSNTDWFPFDFPIEADAIKSNVSQKLRSLGLHAETKPSLSFDELFRTDTSATPLTARAIQSTLVNAADTPGLYILEAPMGMGKTEAALAAAYRRWTEGQERGLYFALPTQLTSERIHERINIFLNNTVQKTPYEDSTQSLIHGNAWLNHSRNRRLSSDSDENDTDEALRWFSSTRRQLLAPFGTGTIDQALLAILPARFAALRYFALAGKVVIIDEVHSYDPYMSALIDRLISYLLKTGSTVIILSATLTIAARSRLVAAAGAVEHSTSSDYPLITKVATGSEQATHIPIPSDLTEKAVTLLHQTLLLETESVYWNSIARHVESGANVVVIRNTVALAQETYRKLKSLVSVKITEDNIGLLHSRFPQYQRLKNEKTWVTRLGKNNSTRPQGSLLVSTQVVEQSVDIDADLLITDIAPTDLILQRIGRLHRHKRDHRPIGVKTPVCHILHPATKWHGDIKEIENSISPHHYVYPAFKLWQGSQYLRSKTSIILPTDIRTILEESSALRPDVSNSAPVSQFLQKAENDFTEQINTAATRNVFAPAASDREGSETRYKIKPTANLILLKEKPLENSTSITITPVHGDPITIHKADFSFPLAKSLHRNSIHIPAYLVREPLLSTPEWLIRHIGDSVLAVLSDQSAELHIASDTPSAYILKYTRALGLSYQKSENDTLTSEPEDYWY